MLAEKDDELGGRRVWRSAGYHSDMRAYHSSVL
jgi:hypothetical protein